MIIVTIQGVHLLVAPDLGTQILTDAKVVKSSGYGAEETFELDVKAQLSMQSFPDSQLITCDDSLLKAHAAAAKAVSEASDLKHELWREQQFWALRSKAHGLGYTDEVLRKYLRTLYSFSTINLKGVTNA